MERLYQILYPMRVVLITSKHGEKENVMAAAWCFPLSAEPPLFGVSVTKGRYSYGTIRGGKAFGINIIGKDMEKEALGAGRASGKGKDKFAELGIGKEYGKLGIPLLKGSQASIECRLVREIELGDHVLFVGEAVNVVRRKVGKGLYHAGGDEFIGV